MKDQVDSPVNPPESPETSEPAQSAEEHSPDVETAAGEAPELDETRESVAAAPEPEETTDPGTDREEPETEEPTGEQFAETDAGLSERTGEQSAGVGENSAMLTTDEPTAEVVFPPEMAAHGNLQDASMGTDEEGNTEDFTAGLPPEAQSLAVELQETKNRLYRSAADFENYRKRVEREKLETSNQVTGSVLQGFFPILDNLERALSACHSGNGQGDGGQGLAEGVEMVVRQFHELLGRLGVSVVPTVGQSFNPAWHEAVRCVSVDEGEGAGVTEELQRGYVLGDRLLRPAMVVVAGDLNGAPRPAAAPVEADQASDIGEEAYSFLQELLNGTEQEDTTDSSDDDEDTQPDLD